MQLTEDQKARFWSRVEIRSPSQCWPWRAGQQDGYGRFCLNGHDTKAHRISFGLFHSREPRRHILHRCSNRICVNPYHLYEGNHVDNARDLLVEGGGGRRKLSNEDVREIRRLYKTGRHPQTRLAIRFGVGRDAIGDVVRGRTHIHV